MRRQRLCKVPPGSLFVDDQGVMAVKTEYRYPNGAPECILIASGEYAHFPSGGEELVWVVNPILVDQLRFRSVAQIAVVTR